MPFVTYRNQTSVSFCGKQTPTLFELPFSRAEITGPAYISSQLELPVPELHAHRGDLEVGDVERLQLLQRVVGRADADDDDRQHDAVLGTIAGNLGSR